MEPDHINQVEDEAPKPRSATWQELRAALREGVSNKVKQTEQWLGEHRTLLEASAILVALWVGVVNCRTYNEILHQTKLQAAHARGTEAARVQCTLGPFGDGGPDITLLNTGQLDARDVTVQYEFQLVTMPDFTPQSGPAEGVFTTPLVRGAEQLNPHTVQKSIPISGYTKAIQKDIGEGRLGLRMRWSGSYNDGLDNTVQFAPTCAYWLHYQPEPTIAGISSPINCDEAKIRLGNAKKDYDDFLKRQGVQRPTR